MTTFQDTFCHNFAKTLAAVGIANGYCYHQHNTVLVVLQKIPDTDKVPPQLPEQDSLKGALHIQKLRLTAGKRIPLNEPLVEVKELPTWSHSSRIIPLSPKFSASVNSVRYIFPLIRGLDQAHILLFAPSERMQSQQYLLVCHFYTEKDSDLPRSLSSSLPVQPSETWSEPNLF